MSSLIKYRSDIDGLRALAVIPVVLYHFGFDEISGGFLGVDVFFVISGFLISGIIHREVEEGRFSIVGFYERRFRRILPALLVVVLLTIFFSAFLYSYGALKDIGRSLIGVATFTSNITFFLESGYFDTASEMKPLIHTWSLAVEEQFYIAYPIFVLLVYRIFPSKFFLLVNIFLIASLLLSQYASSKWPSANFYLIPTRAWELLAGVSCMFVLKSKAKILKSMKPTVFSFISITVLLLCYILFDSSMRHPGFYTAIPVFSVVLLILFGGVEGNLISKALSIKPVVVVGLISYSLYLVHQPLLSFYLVFNDGFHGYGASLFLVVLSVVFSYLLWKYVETPFRNRNRFTRRFIFISSTVMMGAVFLCGIFLYVFSNSQIDSEGGISEHRAECHSSDSNYILPDNACIYGSVPGVPKVAVIGDSHGVELSESLAMTSDGPILHLTYSACPPSFDDGVGGKALCVNWSRLAVSRLLKEASLERVYVVYRINMHLHGDHSKWYPDLSPLNYYVNEDLKLTRWNALVSILDALQRSGLKVYYVLQPPELPKDIKYYYKGYIENVADVDMRGVSRNWWNARNSYVLERLDTIPKGVTVIDPADFLCDQHWCYASRDGEFMYFDDDHLSVKGARYILGHFNRAYP